MNIDDIKALDPKELEDLNRRLTNRLAIEIFVKPIATVIAIEAFFAAIQWLQRRQPR